MMIVNGRFKTLLLLFASVVLMWFSALGVYAQTKIHMVAFCDTGDAKIGESVKYDMNIFRKLMTDIAKALEPEGIKASKNVFSGAQCSPEQARNYVNNLSCQNDIVLFLYSGHGGRSHKDDAESKFPRMSLGGKGQPVKVTEVVNTLEKKHPRLIVMVTDCCNSYYDRGGNSQALDNSRGGSGDGFRTLFLKNRGVACITAASPGEYGWCTQDGGYLTVSLKEALYEADKVGSSATWDVVFKTTQKSTYNATKKSRCPKTQTPYYETRVSDNVPTETPNTNVTEPTSGNTAPSTTTDYGTDNDSCGSPTGSTTVGSTFGNNPDGYTTGNTETTGNNHGTYNSGHKKKKRFSGGMLFGVVVLILLGWALCFKLPQWIKMPPLLEMIARIVGGLIILKGVIDLVKMF